MNFHMPGGRSQGALDVAENLVPALPRAWAWLVKGSSKLSAQYGHKAFLLARSLGDPLPEYAAVCSVFALKQAHLVFAAFHILQRWTSF